MEELAEELIPVSSNQFSTRKCQTDVPGTITNYVYDVDGTRRNKTVGGVAHYYIWEDGRPLKEYVAGKTDIYNAADILYFFYDQNGAPYALMYNNTTYYYILNVQGDVIRLVDSSGATVASYVYDPYGNTISATGSMAQINPLRYRGYYYDQETGFYYLNARYYDPKIGRFLNADAVECLGVNGDTSSYNLFAYCGNNPISRQDAGGGFWETVFDLATLGASIVEVALNPGDPWAWAEAVGDAVDLIPFVTGVGETVKAVKLGKLASKVDPSSTSKISQLLYRMPELTGSNRKKLLATVQNSKLYNLVDQLYRPGALVGDGGTADKLISEFYQGTAEHLKKAKARLTEVNKLIASGTLGLNDLDIAEAIRDDLEAAINLFN